MDFKTFDTRDEFNRRPVAEQLIKLLTSDIDISPMVIDGGWGSGKSEFCEKLIGLIQAEHTEYQAIYLDAFRSDYSGEPLLALLAEVVKACTDEDAENQAASERRQLIKKIANVSGFIFKTTAKAFVAHLFKQNTDVLSAGLEEALGKEGAAKAAETVSETAIKLSEQAIDSTIEALLKEQVEAEKNLHALKALLSDLAQETPLIIFIDELDRCRPDYAVDMLETIKHIFDIKNIKVVLVTNTQQLHAAINHRYGSTVDAKKYLDKFIKFSFSLPEKSLLERYESQQTLASVQYFKQLSAQSLILQKTSLNFQKGRMFLFAQGLVHENNLSLREVETFVRYLEIFQIISNNLTIEPMTYRTIGEKYEIFYLLGVFIFSFNPSITKAIKQDLVDAKEIAKLFNLHQLPKFQNKNPYMYQQVWFMKMISIFLIINCQINRESFQFFNSEEEVKWKQEIDEYFGRRPPDAEAAFSAMKEVFSYLQLSKV